MYFPKFFSQGVKVFLQCIFQSILLLKSVFVSVFLWSVLGIFYCFLSLFCFQQIFLHSVTRIGFMMRASAAATNQSKGSLRLLMWSPLYLIRQKVLNSVEETRTHRSVHFRMFFFFGRSRFLCQRFEVLSDVWRFFPRTFKVFWTFKVLWTF